MRRLVRPSLPSNPKPLHANESQNPASEWHVWTLEGITTTLDLASIAYQLDQRTAGRVLSFALAGPHGPVECSLEVQSDLSIYHEPYVLPALLRSQIGCLRDFCLTSLQRLALTVPMQYRPFTVSFSTHGSYVQVCRPKTSKPKACKKTGEVHYSLSH